jgi:hypothetical protein
MTSLVIEPLVSVAHLLLLAAELDLLEELEKADLEGGQSASAVSGESMRCLALVSYSSPAEPAAQS